MCNKYGVLWIDKYIVLRKPDWQLIMIFFTSSQFFSATAISNQVPCQYRMTSVPLHIISSITPARSIPLCGCWPPALTWLCWCCTSFRRDFTVNFAIVANLCLDFLLFFCRDYFWLSLLIMQLVWPVPRAAVSSKVTVGRRRNDPEAKGQVQCLNCRGGWGRTTTVFGSTPNSPHVIQGVNSNPLEGTHPICCVHSAEDWNDTERGRRSQNDQ